jgi:hypothetical protein
MSDIKEHFFLMGGLLCFFIAAIAALPTGAGAGGGQAYPNGAEAFMPGAAPPPGLTMINYMYFGYSGKLVDDDGDDTDLLDSANVWADLVRLIWISDFRMLGGNYGQHLFLGLLNKDLEFSVPVGPTGKTDYNHFTSPYLIYSPFLMTWHLMEGKLHIATSLADIYVPFDNEAENNLASAGRNFWTFEPVAAITYFPDKYWEMSIKFMYDFNTREKDYVSGAPVTVDRSPGQEFHFDFNFSYAIMENFRVGLNGYFYQQTTDDEFHGLNDLPGPLQDAFKNMEGERSRAMALGPGLFYQYKNIMTTLRYQHEFMVRNKPELQNVWFKVIYVF